MLGRNEFKQKKALTLGISGIINSGKENPETQLLSLTGGKYADFILECSGSATAFNQSVQLTARRGKISLIGFYEQKIPDFDVDSFVTKELQMVGSMGEFGNVEAVAEIMSKHDLRMKNVITDVVAFDECVKAFTPESTQKIIKTIVKF